MYGLPQICLRKRHLHNTSLNEFRRGIWPKDTRENPADAVGPRNSVQFVDYVLNFKSIDPFNATSKPLANRVSHGVQISNRGWDLKADARG